MKLWKLMVIITILLSVALVGYHLHKENAGTGIYDTMPWGDQRELTCEPWREIRNVEYRTEQVHIDGQVINITSPHSWTTHSDPIYLILQLAVIISMATTIMIYLFGMIEVEKEAMLEAIEQAEENRREGI